MLRVHAVQFEERRWKHYFALSTVMVFIVFSLLVDQAEAGQRKHDEKQTAAVIQSSETVDSRGWTYARASQDMHAKLGSGACKALRIDEAALHAAQHILKPMGLALLVLGCPQAPAPFREHVLAVTAVVIDGDRAMNVVRGALGDGEPVDMGSDYLPQRWEQDSVKSGGGSMADADISPDVKFNRRWLKQVMASQGFASVVGPWWAFHPMPRR